MIVMSKISIIVWTAFSLIMKCIGNIDGYEKQGVVVILGYQYIEVDINKSNNDRFFNIAVFDLDLLSCT